jgi:16S rRNA (adenine(1408)-N(1))-methyltransferase
MIIVRGRTTGDIDRHALDALVASRPVTIDLGAGDGAFAYRSARAHPDRFVVAIDPVRENLREYSAKAGKKPDRGGAPNLLYVAASVEMLPDDLRSIAGEIIITLPWGSLMRGLILADPTVLDGVASLARPGAALRIVLNTRIFDDPIPIEARGLPDLTPDYARDKLGPAYAAHGITIIAARWMDADEVAALGTTWAKRLSHRAPPRSVLIEATVG